MEMLRHSKKQFRKLNERLMAYLYYGDYGFVLPTYAIYLCLISFNIESRTFEFCDVVLLHQGSSDSFGYAIDINNSETPHLQLKFTAKRGQSITNE
jgi:hypothetical protein